MSPPRFLLAIPVYNEAAHLPGVMRKARAYLDDILVIDDGSTDRTPQLLADEPCLHVVRHACNLGYGRTLADAFDFAAQHRYDWLITMDCDEQHEPTFLPKFVAAARADRVDLISGSRYLHHFEGNSRPPPDRRRINTRITTMLNARLGLAITDAFCGFKAYRVAALAGLAITEPGYAMPLQFWVQAARAGWRIIELPVRLLYNDPNRHFGGELDDPDRRYQHYLAVFDAELLRADGSKKPPRGGAILSHAKHVP